MAKSNEVDQGKLCAILAYLAVGIVWYFADESMKKNNFVKYHVKQALVLIVLVLVLHILFSYILFWVLFGAFWAVFIIARILVTVLFVIGIINAINGKEAEVPVVGGFAKSFTF